MKKLAFVSLLLVLVLSCMVPVFASSVVKPPGYYQQIVQVATDHQIVMLQEEGAMPVFQFDAQSSSLMEIGGSEWNKYLPNVIAIVEPASDFLYMRLMSGSVLWPPGYDYISGTFTNLDNSYISCNIGTKTMNKFS